MRTPYTLRQNDGKWVAHAVALDIVAAADTEGEAERQLEVLVDVQVSFGIKHGMTMSNILFAAPPEYWEPPFYFIGIPQF